MAQYLNNEATKCSFPWPNELMTDSTKWASGSWIFWRFNMIEETASAWTNVVKERL